MFFHLQRLGLPFCARHAFVCHTFRHRLSTRSARAAFLWTFMHRCLVDNAIPAELLRRQFAAVCGTERFSALPIGVLRSFLARCVMVNPITLLILL